MQVTNPPLLGSWDSAEPETAARSEPSPGAEAEISDRKDQKGSRSRRSRYTSAAMHSAALYPAARGSLACLTEHTHGKRQTYFGTCSGSTGSPDAAREPL